MEVLRKNIRKLLREYFTNDVVHLKKYFTSSDETKINSLPHRYPDYLYEFIKSLNNEIDFEFGVNETNNESLERLQKENPIIFKKFGEYLFDKILHNKIDEPLPSWKYFNSAPEIIKKQWLIHFTNEANSIAVEGFKRGVKDPDNLGVGIGMETGNHGNDIHINKDINQNKYYNFAYLLQDFDKYGVDEDAGVYKYGDEAVMFKASGIKMWHNTDDEPQVIFDGKTAINIIPITRNDSDDWVCYSLKNRKQLYANEKLNNVVNWIVQNYNQYRSLLHR